MSGRFIERVRRYLNPVEEELESVAVLLVFNSDNKEFVDNVHIHGVRDGHLLLAAGEPGAGLDANVVREVTLADLRYAETCSRDERPSSGPTWSLGSSSG
jgi:hypothetical protein